MRWGVTIFKMPPSTAATVNQFPNPKVSDVARGEEGEEGQGGHLLFLIRMDHSSSPYSALSLSLNLSSSGALSLFLTLVFKPFYPPTFPCLLLSPPHFGSPPRDLNGAEEGCHFKCHPSETRDPLTVVFFHSTTSSTFTNIHEFVFLRHSLPFDLQDQGPAL